MDPLSFCLILECSKNCFRIRLLRKEIVCSMSLWLSVVSESLSVEKIFVFWGTTSVLLHARSLHSNCWCLVVCVLDPLYDV